ncbi:hypothetical protein JCM1840_001629, partial [Sporobolomyces johnsonii]
VWLLCRNIPTFRPSDKLDHRCLGPFRILDRKRKNAFVLDLPPHLSSLHPVFHASVLEPYHDPLTMPFSDRHTTTTPDDILPFDPRNPNYAEVEYVIDTQVLNMHFQYLLHWRNCPSSDDSWCFLTDLPVSLTPLLKDFHRHYPR